MKVVFKDNIKSYLLIFLLSIIAGLSVVFFCEFPNNDLWAFSYWSSETFGFWMFSTSLIVLLSEKRKSATINSTIYIFIMFLITTIYKSFRAYWNFYTPYNSLIDLSMHSISGWLLYSIPPALICGILGSILWSGRKNNTWSKILCVLPSIFILGETLLLFHNVFVNHTKLFSAITDLIWFILYFVFLKNEVFKNTNKIDSNLYCRFDHMKKWQIILISIFQIVIIIISCSLVILFANKTFFKTTYIGVNKQEIFIPKYSYFKDESGMTIATFYSLKSEKKLRKEINNYMSDFEYFENDSTYGYRKDDLIIQSYEVVDNGLFRKIFIAYG